ncbi:NACHT domain-containing protein [Phytohabitans sp. LJ34]|uniref:NACHT domain-containing protein n=1 Tax=Phytohabitans sp. LJ34 TaxID=3452217 RepID=UPI003F8B3CBD
MRGVLLRWLGVLAVAAPLAVGFYVASQVASRNGLEWADKAASVAAFFLALGVVAMPAFRRTSRWLSRAPLSDVDVPRAMADLAAVLRGNLAAEERLRKVNDPRPLPVRWEVVGMASGTPAGGDLAGEYADIQPVFARLPARRLVILGAAGAGKSVLLTRLARDLLAARGDTEPVAVIVPIATWDAEEPFDDWLTDQLISNHPGLGAHIRPATGGTISLAGALLARGGILPLLDGFDELPEPVRERAVAAINAHGSDQPMVLTSRPDEYHDAVAAGRAISQAAVVELRPLRLPEVREYLMEATVRPERWQPVFDQLTREPDGPLAGTLTNPLMLWLARTVHEEPTTTPARLTRSDQDRAALETYLLDAFVPAVYGRDAGGRRAERWLAFLAAHLRRIGTPELAWWRLHRALLAWLPVAVGLKMALRVAVLAIAVWSLARYDRSPEGEADIPGLLLGGPLGERLLPWWDVLVGTDVGEFLEGAVERFLHDDDPTRTVLWLALGAWAVLTTVAAIDAVLDTAAKDRRPVTLRLRPLRLLRAYVVQALALAAMLTALAGFGVVVVEGEQAGTELPFWSLVPWLALLAATMASMPVTEPVDVTRAVSPTEVLRLDRPAFVVRRLLDNATTAAGLYLICGLPVPAVYLACTLLMLPVRLAVGTATVNGLFSASQSYADARFWLALTRRLPWRTMAFLSGAHRRGVLRQSGAVYQFRHLRLQEHLAAKHPLWTEQLAPYGERAEARIAPLWERLHAAADRTARAAGLTITRHEWGQHHLHVTDLPARLEGLRAAGGLHAYREIQAAARRADALATRLDGLKARIRLAAGVLRRATYPERARRFVRRRLPAGTDLAEFRWTVGDDLWWTAPDDGAAQPVERIVADLRPHPVHVAASSVVAGGIVTVSALLAEAVSGVLLVVGLLAGAMLWLLRFEAWRTTRFVVTDRRIVLTRDSEPDVELPLAAIADVTAVRSPLGALLGYGRLRVDVVPDCPPVFYGRWPPPWGSTLDLGRWTLEPVDGAHSFQRTVVLPDPQWLLGQIAAVTAPGHAGGRALDAWQKVTRLVELSRSRHYDRAIQLLTELKDAYESRGDGEEFRTRLVALRRDHERKTLFQVRLDRAGL